MRSIVVLLPLALAGCPPPAHYLIADVTAANAPVSDALVAADCRRGGFDGRDAAMRTDETGRARLQLRGAPRAERCTLTVAKPGYRTVETEVVSLCTTVACPALAIDLLPPHAPYTPRDPYVPRD